MRPLYWLSLLDFVIISKFLHILTNENRKWSSHFETLVGRSIGITEWLWMTDTTDLQSVFIELENASLLDCSAVDCCHNRTPYFQRMKLDFNVHINYLIFSCGTVPIPFLLQTLVGRWSKYMYTYLQNWTHVPNHHLSLKNSTNVFDARPYNRALASFTFRNSKNLFFF